jgi:hypothetical protein
MDLTFFRRAEHRFASRSAAGLDYGVLIATLDALQSASAASRALRGCGGQGIAALGRDPLVELILGGPAWREAIEAQCGSFHRGQARVSGNAA